MHCAQADKDVVKRNLKNVDIVEITRKHVHPFEFADYRPNTTSVPTSASSKMCVQRIKNCLILERDMSSVHKQCLDANLSAVQTTKAVDACADHFAARRESAKDIVEDDIRMVRNLP